MGGFAIEVEDDDTSIFPSGTTRVAIRPESLVWLFRIEPSTIPMVSEATIKDKSKADWFAKTLVVLQGKHILL